MHDIGLIDLFILKKFDNQTISKFSNFGSDISSSPKVIKMNIIDDIEKSINVNIIINTLWCINNIFNFFSFKF